MMLVQLLGDLSELTWHLLRDAPFRPREETVTEVLLTELYRLGAGRVWIHKSTIGEEKTYGLDWAWAIRTPAGWLTALVQAKNVGGRRFGIYPELRTRSATEQAEALIHAAHLAGAVPLYAFYNSQVAPFGTDGSVVDMGGCAQARIQRGPSAVGPPWVSGITPLGVSIAHAEDVLERVTPAPAQNQHASSVNRLAMPWECLFCPSWRPYPGTARRSTGAGPPPSGANRISEIAIELAWALLAAGISDDEQPQQPRRQLPAWLRPEPPRWADIVREQAEPELEDDAPQARFFVVIDATRLEA